MYFIEIEIDYDTVYWAVTEYRKGKRYEVERGEEPTLGDALFRAGKCLEALIPEELV
jgi:hypothetical protein